MRRALAGLGIAALLAACSAPKPPETARSPTPAPARTGEQGPGYKPAKSPTLEAVLRRGRLVCGVNAGLPGFALRDARGVWRGFDVDVCRAVAAAALGDAGKIDFVVVGAQERFGPLRAGRIDILSRNTSRTFARDAGLGVTFPVTTYYDGQGFLAPKALGLGGADELAGARICVQEATASAGNLQDWFAARGMKYRAVMTTDEPQARQFYENDTCDVFTSDVSALAASRSLLRTPGAHAILGDVISKEPLGPVVRRDDPVWADIVAWSVYATLVAEELHVASRNVENVRETTTDPETRRLLGLDDNLGGLLGLKSDWAFQVIRQVGAYDEIFARNLGSNSALRLDRGLNALWNASKPGLMYPPPMR